MRSAPAFLILALVACAPDSGTAEEQAASTTEPAAASGLSIFAGAGRDRFCLDPRAGRAGFITYGDGDANCSVRASVQQTGDRIAITPDGDQSCRIDGVLAGTQIRLGEVGPGCDYYCGPGADFAGRIFERSAGGTATDLAGDPLC